MTKRICYIHAGPHKSGTTSIQWFLQDVTEQFTPNDFEVRAPDWLTMRRLRHAISKNEQFRATAGARSRVGGRSALERCGPS